jgi:thiosulfate dehydrogenase (quinone) large subunit
MAPRTAPVGSPAQTQMDSLPLGLPTRFDIVAAYTVLRIALGLAMFMHGLARFIAGIDTYAQHYIAGFATVALPHDLVVFVIYTIPYLEVVIGLPIVLGLFTRSALLANAALLVVFLFGTSMQQSWGGVATQLTYTLIVSLLLLGSGLNVVSLDNLIAQRGGKTRPRPSRRL